MTLSSSRMSGVDSRAATGRLPEVRILESLKPIFRCDVKTLALGCRVGQYPQCESFALGIPTCWYLKMLKFVLPPMRTLKFGCPHREQVEYSLCWVPKARGWGWPCRFHVVCLIFGRVGCPMQTRYPVE